MAQVLQPTLEAAVEAVETVRGELAVQAVQESSTSVVESLVLL
jgi:hypothetical protein